MRHLGHGDSPLNAILARFAVDPPTTPAPAPESSQALAGEPSPPDDPPAAPAIPRDVPGDRRLWVIDAAARAILPTPRLDRLPPEAAYYCYAGDPAWTACRPADEK